MLYNFDFLRILVGLTYKKKENFPTLVGSITSIFATILIIWYTYISCEKVLLRLNPIVTFQDLRSQESEPGRLAPLDHDEDTTEDSDIQTDKFKFSFLDIN